MTILKATNAHCKLCKKKGMGKWRKVINRAMKPVTRRSCRYCFHFEDK